MVPTDKQEINPDYDRRNDNADITAMVRVVLAAHQLRSARYRSHCNSALVATAFQDRLHGDAINLLNGESTARNQFHFRELRILLDRL